MELVSMTLARKPTGFVAETETTLLRLLSKTWKTAEVQTRKRCVEKSIWVMMAVFVKLGAFAGDTAICRTIPAVSTGWRVTKG